MAKTREEHLDWCKQRAIEYAERGDLDQALNSFWSDIGKHHETMNYSMVLFQLGIIHVKERNKRQMIEYINGFR